MSTSSTREASFVAPVVGPAFLVSQVGALAALEFAARLAPLKLTPQHAGILRIVDVNSGLSQQALSALLGIFASRLVLLLDDLEKERMIVRTPSPSDRRSYGLHLTARGRRALATIGKLTVDLETQLFANLNRKEVSQLAALLSRVVDEQSLPPGVHAAYRQLDPPPRRRSSKRGPMQHTFVSKIHNGKNRA